MSATRPLSLSTRESLLVTPEEVNSWASGSYVPLDATWLMPAANRNPHQEFEKKRIPNARYFDLDKVASQHPLGLPHMMPDSQTFAGACESLGIDRGTRLVFYDTHGVFSSPRALFTFKAFGHEEAVVLNGGLPRWEVEGHPLETEPPSAPWKATYKPLPELDESVIRSYEQIIGNTHFATDDKAGELLLDARSRERYSGEAQEPRPGLPAGHIPNSLSLPFSNLLESHLDKSPSYTTMLPVARLRAAVEAALGPYTEDVLTGKRSLVNTCGSGMTAAIVWLALQELGVKSALYDESWTGYALRKESPVATGSD
ncbi:Rhodanese-like protein [Calocera viscosa TUFC12733]|uniref:Rhodanese-like protein n=1 Tax=Calocera viscosa (strain TUFC12733) TaxID=1330018 RepID=A0A167KTD2_CALVF|nr:Rhodanese-like protein [Calocera viscosa TUFC12733]